MLASLAEVTLNGRENDAKTLLLSWSSRQLSPYLYLSLGGKGSHTSSRHRMDHMCHECDMFRLGIRARPAAFGPSLSMRVKHPLRVIGKTRCAIAIASACYSHTHTYKETHQSAMKSGKGRPGDAKSCSAAACYRPSLVWKRKRSQLVDQRRSLTIRCSESRQIDDS
jgi:hypothetical protein